MATLDINPELHAEIAWRAEADGATQAALVEVALRRYLDRVEERSPRLSGEEVLDVPNHASHALPADHATTSSTSAQRPQAPANDQDD
jgi:hypothetical protein